MWFPNRTIDTNLVPDILVGGVFNANHKPSISTVRAGLCARPLFSLQSGLTQLVQKSPDKGLKYQNSAYLTSLTPLIKGECVSPAYKEL